MVACISLLEFPVSVACILEMLLGRWNGSYCACMYESVGIRSVRGLCLGDALG